MNKQMKALLSLFFKKLFSSWAFVVLQLFLLPPPSDARVQGNSQKVIGRRTTHYSQATHNSQRKERDPFRQPFWGCSAFPSYQMFGR